MQVADNKVLVWSSGIPNMKISKCTTEHNWDYLEVLKFVGQKEIFESLHLPYYVYILQAHNLIYLTLVLINLIRQLLRNHPSVIQCLIGPNS